MSTDSTGASLVLYVSPEGDDEWSGRMDSPSPGRTDGPLATLERARDLVQAHRRNAPDCEVTVLIRGGIYRCTRTIVFGLEDSGSAAAPITYAAYPGERPVFSAGVPITGWRRLEEEPAELPHAARGNVWVADLPAGMQRFFTLYAGGRRLERARGEPFPVLEQAEYEPTASLNTLHEKDRPLLRRVPFPRGGLRNWDNLADIELRFTPVPWTMNLLPLESVDEASGEARLAVEATAPPTAKNGAGFQVENVVDYLDRPGHWVLNTRQRKIYLWPEGDRPGEEIVAPVLREIIRVEGQVDPEAPADIPVRNLVFRGLTFTHGDRCPTPPGYKGWGIQHDWEMFDTDTAMVRFRGAEDCRVEACRFTNSGGTGLRLDLHCQRVHVESNLIDHVGAMGILLCGYGPGTKDVNRGNQIVNNLIHHCGEVIWHGHAIFVWQSGSNRIAHNLIHDCPRKAIGLCGVRIPILENRDHRFDEAVRTIRWHEIDAVDAPDADAFDRFLPFLHARHNLVECNEVYRVLERLGDGAAVNVSGAGEGNVIRGNYIHHIASYNATCVLRVDDWQRGTMFRDNIVYMSNIAAITRKNLNHIENNLFIDANTREYVRFASYPDEKAAHGSRIRRNIFYESGPAATFYATAYLASPGVTLPQHCDSDYNVFYCAEDPSAGEQWIAGRRKEGTDAHSISADPDFMAPGEEDFRLRPGSPALALGFEPIAMDTIGLRDDFPRDLLRLDEPGENGGLKFDRGRNPKTKSYAWW